jgi:hypothetical protein
MRTPVRTVPAEVKRWAFRARWLRWLDGLAAFLVIWPLAALALDTTAVVSALSAALLAAGAALFWPLRARWRPVSALVALSASRELRPGDRAWYVLPDRVEPVIVTARRRLRLVVARPEQEPAEGIEVRRTRVLVIRSAP